MNITFRTFSLVDIHLLHEWLQEPHVHKWWGENRSWSLEDIEVKYSTYSQGFMLEKDVKKGIHSFIIEIEERPIGYIQYYNAFDFDREGFDVKVVFNNFQSIAGLDFYIGEAAYLGKGFGAQILKQFLDDYVFPHFSTCLVDPDKNNMIAIKVYEKAGFSRFLEINSTVFMIAKR